MKSFLKANKISRVENAVAAGTSDITTDWVDMQNFESIVFLVLMGAITTAAVTSIKVQQSTDSGGSGAADLEGTAFTIADTDDDKVVAVEIFRPRERYVALIVDRGTQNAVVDGILAIQSGPRVLPVTQHTNTIGNELHGSPAEGTA